MSEAAEAHDPAPRENFVVLRAVVIGLALLCAIALCAVSAVTLPALQRKNLRTQCASRLRVIGMGAIEYASDKRFYPHVGNLRQLDGGPETNHATRSVRSLLNFGYVNDPSVFVCEAADHDRVHPTARAPASWFWNGDTRPDPTLSAFADGLQDPTLLETTELSYGWTRRTLSSGGARSIDPVAADRRVRPGAYPRGSGNHSGGGNVFYADGSVKFETPDLDHLLSQKKGRLGPVGVIPLNR